MSIQKTHSGITHGFNGFEVDQTAKNPVNPTPQIGSAKRQYTLLSTKVDAGDHSPINSESIQSIGYIALRIFLVLGAIGLMVVGHPVAIAIGVLLFLFAVCTLTSAKDRHIGEIDALLTSRDQFLIVNAPA